MDFCGLFCCGLPIILIIVFVVLVLLSNIAENRKWDRAKAEAKKNPIIPTYYHKSHHKRQKRRARYKIEIDDISDGKL